MKTRAERHLFCFSQPTDEAQLKKVALGLTNPYAAPLIAYLQGFAIHELASTLPPPQASAVASALIAGNSSKRRKIDIREPTKPEDWLDMALARYQVAQQWWTKAAEDEATPESSHAKALLEADALRAQCDRAVVYFLAEQEGKGIESMKDASLADATKWLEESHKSPGSENADYLEERGDAAKVVLRAVTTFLAVLDGFPNCREPKDRVEELRAIFKALKLRAFRVEGASNGEAGDYVESREELAAAPEAKKRQLELALLMADAALAIFIALEEAVEEKYRPGDEDEDEDEDDEEDAVIPLPDEEDVREAKREGETGTIFAVSILFNSTDEKWVQLSKLSSKALACYRLRAVLTQRQDSRISIKRYVSFFTFYMSWELTFFIYLANVQLEEAYLTLSALVNPENVEETHFMDEALEKVRKDGNLE